MYYRKVAILLIFLIIASGCIEKANSTETTDISENKIYTSAEIENNTTPVPERTESQFEIILQKPPRDVIGGE